MHLRRRVGAGLAVATALLAAAPTATAALRGRSDADAPSADVRALADEAPAPVDLPHPTTTATTAPPPPPPPTTACPVAGPVTFVDSWGSARSGGRRHEGVDMLAAEGTPVVAPVSGSVTQRENRVGGLSFYLEGNDGNFWYGTHLSAYGTTGWVEAGTVIGYVGDSGNARGTPHLHLEIHPGGQANPAVDPYPAAALLCSAERTG